MTIVHAARSTCLEVRGVHKRFGATLALQDVSLDVLQGEVHALLGHNGSGKSTVVKIISGAVVPDAGRIEVRGQVSTAPRVGIVHQDLALCLDASVLENCFMGSARRGRLGLIDWKGERASVEPLLETLSADFDCGAVVGELSPADQAVVAIARALRGRDGGNGLDLLVLDEATARLRGRDADKVLSTARRVAARGGGVLLVTHHMSEVLHAADRATVLSSGRVAGSVEVADTTEDELLELVSGRRLQPQTTRPGGPQRSADSGMLTIKGLTGDGVHDLTVNVAAGEIVGLTGAAGAGHEEVPYLLAGARPTTAGEVRIEGRQVRGDVSRRRRAGIGLVPADRLQQGLLTTGTIRENLSPLVRRRHTRFRFSVVRDERRWAQDVCDRFAVLPSDPEVLTGSLSGGNQQKVLLARVLGDQPKVLILHEPTQGVDEATRRGLVDRVREAAAGGAAVLYVSSDIEEVAGCADRVLVFRKGAVVEQISGGLDRVDDIYAASYLTGPGAEPGGGGQADPPASTSTSVRSIDEGES
jgi:ABC-type sugar transport system ATPase subunit